MPYRPPTVERLTEQVLSVRGDGTAILRLTLTAEPGFEDEEHPQAVVTQTVTVSAWGQVSGASGDGVPERLLSAIYRLPAAPNSVNTRLQVLTQTSPLVITQNASPGHDGLLRQTTRRRRRDRVVFDSRTGQVVRRVTVLTGSLSLVMIRPSGRDAADFGHVVPNLPLTQTLTVERKSAL